MQVTRHLHRQAGFAHATWSHQRHQTHGGTTQQFQQMVHLAFTTDQRGQFGGFSSVGSAGRDQTDACCTPSAGLLDHLIKRAQRKMWQLLFAQILAIAVSLGSVLNGTAVVPIPAQKRLVARCAVRELPGA